MRRGGGLIFRVQLTSNLVRFCFEHNTVGWLQIIKTFVLHLTYHLYLLAYYTTF
jgi:hypothetical protein